MANERFPTNPPDGLTVPPPSVFPQSVKVPDRVKELVAETPRSVRNSVPASPHARNIDSLRRDISTLSFPLSRTVDRRAIDTLEILADETRNILHFLYGERLAMRGIHLAPFAQNRIRACQSALEQDQSDSSHLKQLWGHVVLARNVEDGVAEHGLRWLFQKSDAGLNFSPNMLAVMAQMTSVRGFDVKQDVKNLVQSLQEDYRLKGITPSREQLIADYHEMVASMCHRDTYQETEPASVRRISDQKQRMQNYLQHLSEDHNVGSDAQRFRDVVRSIHEGVDIPAQFFHLESLMNVAVQHSGGVIPVESLRYSISALNRYLMQGYYAAFLYKLMGANV